MSKNLLFKKNNLNKIFLVILLITIVCTENVFARHPDFMVPNGLRPRVNFWIDIFTRYGKDQVLVHHRDFPQAVFGVIDFRSQSAQMAPRQYELYKERIKTEKTKLIERALQHLATGKSPRNPIEKLVQEVMAVVPGGHGKYRKAYQEGLVRTQTGISERYREAVERSGRYMHILVGTFKAEGLPIELTRLPFIESSFDYKAYSSVGAAGIWQFMAATGRSFGMRIDNLIDERRDIVTATRGAAKYLKSAYKQLGTWPLALTSYNHGVGGVRSKVKKLGSNDIVQLIEHPSVRLFGFASSNFYPEFLAALEIYENPAKYFPGIVIEPARELVEYRLPNSFGASHLSRVLNISIDTLKEYNYAVSSRVWSGAYQIPRGYVLKLPVAYDNKLSLLGKPMPNNVAVNNQQQNPSQRFTTHQIPSGAYRVQRGDTLASIAKRHGMSIATLQSINGLKGSSIYAGQQLRVSTQATKTNTNVTTSTSSATYHTVRSGQTLWSISRTYGKTIAQIKAISGLRSDVVKPGQRIRVK
jgi:membrane-bound lytic murein transglycosylase D